MISLPLTPKYQVQFKLVSLQRTHNEIQIHNVMRLEHLVTSLHARLRNLKLKQKVFAKKLLDQANEVQTLLLKIQYRHNM